MRKAVISTLTGAALTVAGPVFSVEKAKNEVPISQNERALLLPSSDSMIGLLSESAGDAQISARVVNTPHGGIYGFTTDVPKEQGSFRLGQLLADVESTLRVGDREKTLDAIDALSNGLVELGAKSALISAVMELTKAVQNRQDLTAIGTLALPVLRPFLETFVMEQGKLAYMRLGEWTESITIALNSEAGASTRDSLKDILEMAERYISVMKGEKDVAPGVMGALQNLKKLGMAKSIDARQSKEIRSTTEQLVSMLG